MMVIELLECHARAALLSGARVRSFVPDAHWFARWQEEYGLSMRRAIPKFQVPRSVLKERLEIFWVNLFRVRFLIQSVFNHNECGAQKQMHLESSRLQSPHRRRQCRREIEMDS